MAKKQLRKIQKNATEFRVDHLKKLAEEAEEEENYAHARYLRNLISIESQQQMHAVIRSYTKDKVNSSLTYIDVPKDYPKNWNDVPKYLPATSLRRVDNIEEMEKIINERNVQHLQQAEGTPFTIEPLKTILGEDGCTEECNKILMGTYDDSNIDLTHLQKQYLKALKKRSGKLASPLRNEISTKDIRKGFSKWKERTSTSPSQRHLGHYKALLVSDGRENNEIYTQQTNQLIEIHSTIINACIKLGQPLQRWLKSNAIMIEKEINYSQVNRLRIINLYEADYNLILKLLAV